MPGATALPGADEQITPNLDVIMKEGLQQFDLTEDGEGFGAVPGDNTRPGPDADRGGRNQVVASGDTEIVTDPPPALRFTNHEEAEKGYKNLQGEHTRLAEENKALKTKIDAEETDRLRKTAEETADYDLVTFATTRRRTMLDEIDALDPDVPDYRDQVAGIQAKADRDIFKQSKTVIAAPPAPARPQPQPAANTKPVDTEQVISYVKDKITSVDIGLDKDDELFWLMTQQTPDKDQSGNTLTLDQQIQWAADQTINYRSRILGRDRNQQLDDTTRTAETNRRRDMPLGRHAADAPTTGKGDDKPVSLADAVDSAKNMRRL